MAERGSERKITIRKNDNQLVVRAAGSTWVALERDGRELLRDLSGNRETSFGVGRGTYVVRSDGKIAHVEARSVSLPEAGEAAALRLSADAPDVHPVDGVPEIAADGKSFTTVTVQKVGADGAPLRRRTDTDEVFVRTTGGALRDGRGRPVRSVRLSGGKATFRLVSEAVGRVVTVEAVAQAPLVGATLRVEFV
jgi:hypothetical protein